MKKPINKPTLCNQCQEFLAACSIDLDETVVLCYDCALELQKRYYEDFLFKTSIKVKKMMESYEKSIDYQEKKYNETVKAFGELLKDLAKKPIKVNKNKPSI
jgi:hypothetical protein